MGDIFGWRLFDFLWWVVDTIFSKCINRRFLTVNFVLLYWSSVSNHCNFFAYVRQIIIFSVCGPFYWILHNLMITSFLSLKFDWNFSCCCSKVTEKLTMELATEIHFTVESYWSISHSFFSWSTKIHLFINADVCFSFFFLFRFLKMFLLTITRRKVS